MNLQHLSICMTASAIFSMSLVSGATSAAPTVQQQRMTDCNAAAKTQGLSGAARKTFMKNCLNGRETLIAPDGTIQQEKMKLCNEDANRQALKGNSRKQFMSTCLKNK